jgi:branched-subunit amino acid transport protein
MSGYALMVLAVAAGVLLPKVVPAIALRSDPPASAQRWFSAVPPALLGALTIPMVGRFAASVTDRTWLSVTYVSAYLVIGIVAKTVRRTSVSFAIGFLLLAVLQLVTRFH